MLFCRAHQCFLENDTEIFSISVEGQEARKGFEQMIAEGLPATAHIGVESTLKKLLEFEPKMFAQHRANAGHSLLLMCCFVHFM